VKLPFRRRPQRDAELDEEIQSHLAMAARERIERGEPAEAAAHAARREFGNVGQVKELTRQMWAGASFERLLDELRHALRTLRKNPSFTAVAVLTLALGLGATSTMFGVVDTLFLRPPPGVGHPGNLVRLETTLRPGAQPPSGPIQIGGYTTSFSRIYQTLRDNARALSGLAAYGALEDVSVGGGADAAPASALLVSGNYFLVLDVRPALGRFFLPAEDAGPGSPSAVVVSHAFWERHLHGDRSAVGKPLDINAHRFTVVGVAPAGFHGIDPGMTALWIPVSQQAHVRLHSEQLVEHPSPWEQMVGRLRPGASHDAAAQQLAAVLQGASPGLAAFQVNLLPVLAARGPHASREALIARWLAVAAALVLAIACANVANLLLARAATRRGDIAVRLALGASRWRLARQVLTESLLLAALGAGAGLLLAIGGARVLPTMGLPTVGVFAQGRVFLFAALAATACGMLFGLAPALSSARAELAIAMKEGGGEAYPPSRLRALLVVAQVALATVLLSGAGLFVHSLRNLLETDPGFDVAHLLRVSGDLTSAGYNDTTIALFKARAVQRLRELPEVVDASLVSSVPLSGADAVGSYHVPRRAEEAAGRGTAYFAFVGSGYFTTTGTPLVQGRDFTDGDNGASPLVAIVNQALAQREWPHGSPIGECIGPSARVCYTIVGVAADAQYVRVGESQRLGWFIPIDQVGPFFPERFRADIVAEASEHLTLLVRTARNPVAAIPAVRHALQQLAPSLPYMRVEPFLEVLAPELEPRRLGATMFSAFGGLALVLAAVGLYGLVAYTVQRRTREMGIRIALGAAPRHVLGLVAWQGALLMLTGLAIGVGGGLAMAHLVAHLLFGVSAMDPVTFAGACVLLCGAGLVAGYFPARQALRVDPVNALRAE
jgi:putative ABC transport system permease protein